MRLSELLIALAACAAPVLAQTNDYRLALPDHKGQLEWSIGGFKIVENSAKPNGREIGVRGLDASGRLTFLGFLFLVPESDPLTSAKCRDSAIAQEKKADATLKILKTDEISRPSGLPVAFATYAATDRGGALAYRVRAFVAAEDICGDLEFYSRKPISDEDTDLKKALQSYQLDLNYSPQFSDVALYAQVLFQHHDYKAAAPLFGRALTIVPPDGGGFKSATLARRIMRDQAGMSYGISGDLKMARRIFEAGSAEDPDYPMNYYNLACADAGEKNLSDARTHLQQAFDRKANMNPGEKMPIPAEDDSFLPYKSNQEFWTFIERLGGGK